MATLLLRLAAPLQSWGASSKFETRRTNYEPTKSGVIGLLAAALGIKRGDDEAIRRLCKLHFAVRVDQEGVLLDDYQCVGMPTPQEVKKLRAANKSATAYCMAHKHYLQDAIFLAAFESDDLELLEKLQQALTHPVYTLFLGRRSCPPTQPLCLGIRNGGLMETLKKEPSLVPKWRGETSDKYRIVSDAPQNARNFRCETDVPVSFNPNHRRFGLRPISESMVDRPRSSDSTLSYTTSQDPFEEWK